MELSDEDQLLYILMGYCFICLYGDIPLLYVRCLGIYLAYFRPYYL